MFSLAQVSILPGGTAAACSPSPRYRVFRAGRRGTVPFQSQSPKCRVFRAGRAAAVCVVCSRPARPSPETSGRDSSGREARPLAGPCSRGGDGQVRKLPGGTLPGRTPSLIRKINPAELFRAGRLRSCARSSGRDSFARDAYVDVQSLPGGGRRVHARVLRAAREHKPAARRRRRRPASAPPTAQTQTRRAPSIDSPDTNPLRAAAALAPGNPQTALHRQPQHKPAARRRRPYACHRPRTPTQTRCAPSTESPNTDPLRAAAALTPAIDREPQPKPAARPPPRAPTQTRYAPPPPLRLPSTENPNTNPLRALHRKPRHKPAARRRRPHVWKPANRLPPRAPTQTRCAPPPPLYILLYYGGVVWCSLVYCAVLGCCNMP